MTPDPEQYGHGSVITRSRLCFTRLRVMMISPKSDTWTALDGDPREVKVERLDRGDDGYRVFRFRYLLPLTVEVQFLPPR